MIYPIIPYGKAVLRQQAKKILHGTDLKHLIKDMFETMDASNGVGLAAPQIGKSIQLFVMDISYFMQNASSKDNSGKRVYINPILEFPTGNVVLYQEEGCLSIPAVYGMIPRHKIIKVTFYDSDWNLKEEILEDFPARVVQHEYDHLIGKLHIDYLLSTAQDLDRKKIEAQLKSIKKGKVSVNYPMSF